MIHWPTETNGDYAKTAKSVIARTAGEVSIAMVRSLTTYHVVTSLTSNLVCKTDAACVGFPIMGSPVDRDDADLANMTCYKGGETVFNNHQMCDVTST